MQIETNPLSLRELEEGSQLHFPAGLLGFPERKDYRIVNHKPDTPFKWLQATDVSDLAFVITDPFAFFSDYLVDIQAHDLRELGDIDPEQLMLVVIVALPRASSSHLTMNLCGPVLINCHTGLAKQLVLVNSPYPARQPLVAAHEPAS